MTGRLGGRIAVVAGATRGAGRGIAMALGEEGATVYCTGRSTRESRSELGRPETIEETAERVDAAGGHGVAARVDHADEGQVKALFDRVSEEQGRLDVLVNDVWGGDPYIEWGKPFWELDIEKELKVLRQAVFTHIITARHGAPLLMRSDRGLLVEVTDGDGMWYRGNLTYDLVKTTVIRLAFSMAEELRPRGVASIAVTPGFLRSEMMLDLFGVTEAHWRDAVAEHPDFIASETPLFVGRGVARLAADPDVMRRSGRVFASWTLAKEYGFDDADGTRQDWSAHTRSTYGDEAARIMPPLDDAYSRYLGDHAALRRMFAQAFEGMATQRP